MSKTMRQKSRRMQNRLMLEQNYYANNLTDQTAKGVGYRDVAKVLNGARLPALKADGSIEQIESKAKGAYNAFQKSYKGTGLGKHKTHIRTPSDYLHDLKVARKQYRTLCNVYLAKGGQLNIFDRMYKLKFPKQWQIIVDNKREFMTD